MRQDGNCVKPVSRTVQMCWKATWLTLNRFLFMAVFLGILILGCP